MIRRILYVAALLAGVCEASAAGRAEEILGRVAEGFRAMKDYTVRFEVAADEYRTPGSYACLLYTSPSPRDKRQSRMPSSA